MIARNRRIASALVRSALPALLIFSVAAAAQDPGAAGAPADALLCEDGPTNKTLLFSTLTTVLASVVMAVVGLQTLARWLASIGYRQSPATMAGLGLGAWLGGGAGAVVMASTDCGFAYWPGFLGSAVSGLGFVVLLFSVLTGKR